MNCFQTWVCSPQNTIAISGRQLFGMEIANNLAILISSEDINIIFKGPPCVGTCHLDRKTIGRDFAK